MEPQRTLHLKWRGKGFLVSCEHHEDTWQGLAYLTFPLGMKLLE